MNAENIEEVYQADITKYYFIIQKDRLLDWELKTKDNI